MELANVARKASKFASEEDIISSIPENVITNILDCLPIQDAVRTGILSRNWRFKWTTLTKLIFDKSFFDYLLRPEELLNNDMINYDWRNIGRILLHFKGAITNFVLYIPPRYNIVDVEEINHWIMFLSRKGIKEFTIINYHETSLTLPSHLFSCLELKHLNLYHCRSHPPPSFRGFPNLLSLELSAVKFESFNFGEFITWCPLLEIFKLCFSHRMNKSKLTEFAKLENLKVLSIPLHHFGDIMITSSSIFQLVNSLPKLQELCLSLVQCKFAETGSSKRVPTSFPCLTTLNLFGIDFSSRVMLSFAFEMIWGFPNLQTLEIAGRNKYAVPPPELVPTDIHWNTKDQLQLHNVSFLRFKGSENEVCLIKYLLACSPLLNKIVIRFDPNLKFTGEDKFKFARKLLKLYRASTIAVVDLE